MKLLFSALFSFLLFITSRAQLPAIIPQPAELRIHAAGDKFTIDNGTLILISDTALIRPALYLKDYVLKHYGITLHTDVYAVNGKKKNTIRLIRTASTTPNPGQYMLNVLDKNISINASTDEGIFYGVQTLLQLLPVKQGPPLDIPSVDITDYPVLPTEACTWM